MLIKQVIPLRYRQIAERMRRFPVEVRFAEFLRPLDKTNQTGFLGLEISIIFDNKSGGGAAIFFVRHFVHNRFFDKGFEHKLDKRIRFWMLVVVQHLVRDATVREHLGNRHFAPQALRCRCQIVDALNDRISNGFCKNIG